MSRVKVVEIEKVEEKTPTVKSLFFDWGKDFKPGQFVMIWIPGVDEIPMAIARKKLDFITVKKRGEATETLHEMELDDKIGVRGPLGNSYSLEEDPILIVTGGCGGASLIEGVYEAERLGKNVISCLGAETEEELLFRDEFSHLTDMKIATDDGSAGREGFVTELAAEVIDREDIGSVLTCGPESMMEKVVEMCFEKNIPVQASLERYMKCGIGICDSCAIDGKQVCIDGPVFRGEELVDIEEFGKFERKKDGRLEEI
ncbi:MAG: dihydroorotate dehydrogenase electron transfer subunit [Candidatus Thermoplasmatota archaeon]|nr:dihydroorotate dehydrogenase electron transfer subunit [Candidatus Thermoplasmatota archaeon]MBS3790831.1 dihydroorotate dehydrogenase electron transfer subunit [Candidatus Thermoplasmatota archaeon]